jgi:hypothetical protein
MYVRPLPFVFGMNLFAGNARSEATRWGVLASCTLNPAAASRALARLRAARSLSNFPTLEQAKILASQVEQSRYSSGSPETRARVLAWCARLLI